MAAEYAGLLGTAKLLFDGSGAIISEPVVTLAAEVPAGHVVFIVQGGNLFTHNTPDLVRGGMSIGFGANLIGYSVNNTSVHVGLWAAYITTPLQIGDEIHIGDLAGVVFEVSGLKAEETSPGVFALFPEPPFPAPDSGNNGTTSISLALSSPPAFLIGIQGAWEGPFSPPPFDAPAASVPSAGGWTSIGSAGYGNTNPTVFEQRAAVGCAFQIGGTAGPYQFTGSASGYEYAVTFLAGFTAADEEPAPPTFLGVTNAHSRLGLYGAAYEQGGMVVFVRSDFTTPPFAFSAPVTSGTEDSSPDLAWEPTDERLYCVFQRGTEDAADVLEAFSDDDGLTWSDPTVTFTGCQHPQITIDRFGTILRAAFLPDEDDDTIGTLRGTIQRAGEVSPGAEFTFADTDRTPLSVQADSFGLSAAPDDERHFLLAVRLAGTDGVSHFASTDDGETWEQNA